VSLRETGSHQQVAISRQPVEVQSVLTPVAISRQLSAEARCFPLTFMTFRPPTVCKKGKTFT
jgi:hypothetical protein